MFLLILWWIYRSFGSLDKYLFLLRNSISTITLLTLRTLEVGMMIFLFEHYLREPIFRFRHFIATVPARYRK